MASKRRRQPNPPETSVAGTPLRKITIKTVWGSALDIEEVLAAPDRLLPIMDVWGIAGRFRAGESDLGPYTRFVGQFKATNLKTGEIFRASACLLPKFLEEDLVAAMTVGESAEVKNAQFGVRIYAKFDKNAATKYIYVADSLVEAATSDAMLALEQQIKGAAAALPAPKD